jgi:hypothetical protein
MAALAGGIAYGTTASCSNTATLNGSAFEVDTNANLVVNTTGCIDWLTGGAETQFRSGVTVKQDSASGQNDESFGNGTKEDTAVPSIVTGGIPPNKSDLKAFGVYTEQGEVTAANPTGKYLALFWTRVQDPSGTTNMDFELNQSSTKSANGVTPVRTSGDKLITYDLSNGGTVATISIRTWNGSAWGNPTVISNSNTGARGSINTSQIASNASGGLGTLDARTFGEATISFNTLFGTNQCGSFGSAYLKSRSADTFTSALKDFVPPAAVSISNCAAIKTNATQSATIGGSISDSAELTGVGTNATGTITFHLYPSLSDCQNKTSEISTGLTPATVSGPGTYSSGSYTPAAVGTYYWVAEYSGDANNTSISGKCGDANESSTIVKKQPAISTSASNGMQATAQTIGGSISDTATLSSATSDAGGSITFKLYSDSDCQNEVTTNLNPVSVSGNNDYNSGNFTPTAVGTYYWIASYSGDAKNEAVSGSCGDPNESSIVVKKAPAISTNATGEVTIDSPISDTATLSGATSDAGGSITFKLYSDSDCQNEVTTNLNPVSVSGNNDYNSGNFTPTAVGTYYWIASYSGDAKNEAVSGSCGDPNESSVVKKALATADTAQKLFPQDSATLSSANNAGGTPTGTVDFALYGPNDADCSGPAAYTEENVDLTSGTANTDNTTFSVDQAKSGDYKWIVHYDGDAKHEEATSACGKEAFTATIDNDTTD